MKKTLLSLFILLFSFHGFSQLLSWSPDFPTESTAITITVDASKGNRGLMNYNPADVYVHIGVITDQSSGAGNWKYVKTTWGNTDPSAKAVSLGNNKWSFTISGSLKSYFGVPNGEAIKKIAILFRSGNGSFKQANADGSDMYLPVYTSATAIRIVDPFFQPTYLPVAETITKTVGDNLPVTAISNNAANLKLFVNGTEIQTATGATTISATPTFITGGNQQIKAEASDGTSVSADIFNFFVTGAVNIAALPTGVRDGINYDPNNSSATLVLYAPGKGRVCVIGEFPGSNWAEQNAFQMNKTPDGNYWWLTLTDLIPGKEYAFQYLVNGSLKIAEPYAEKVLDPNSDPGISTSTYPGLKPYPSGFTTGIASILQTAKPAYNWQVDNFSRPDKRSLVIYELLVRDFVANHNWNTLRDTLNYLKNLGINAIEIMPFNEFEGNNSWGYNPNFYFAPDKYYGPENTLKEFIDVCHKNGIAVIMDVALNHSFGTSPFVQLYWDAAGNKPSADNPWFNPVAKHAYNVGFDMNHESLVTRYFVSRVIAHWLQNYKIDGFRFDLSKGFTQTKTCDDNGGNCNVGEWGNYDQSRIDIWKRYYDTMQVKSPSSYCILEHFADNSEEQVLSDYGMMLWGNSNYNYSQASMGFSTDWNFNWGLASQRGWTNPYLVTYMESHDEERLMFKNMNYGNASGGYDIKDAATALQRQELAAAFFLTLPGPKMIWQFGELGYDFSINYCVDGSIKNDCRTSPKPIRWDYFQQSRRRKLYDVYSALIKLRFNPSFKDLFISNSSQQSLSGNFKWIKLDKVVVIGNFDVVTQTGSVSFPSAGIWYDYLNGTTIMATGSSQSFTLQPGEYHVFTSVDAVLPVTILNFTGKKTTAGNLLQWQVAQEENLSFYQVEKSTTGQDFKFVAKINAVGESVYHFTDKDQNNNPVEYYRLKSVDKDGRFSYSGIVKIKSSVNSWQVSISPNPYFGELKLNIESIFKDQAIIIITDLSGRELAKQSISVTPGKNSFTIPEASKFAKGTYYLSLFSSSETRSLKFVRL